MHAECIHTVHEERRHVKDRRCLGGDSGQCPGTWLQVEDAGEEILLRQESHRSAIDEHLIVFTASGRTSASINAFSNDSKKRRGDRTNAEVLRLARAITTRRSADQAHAQENHATRLWDRRNCRSEGCSLRECCPPEVARSRAVHHVVWCPCGTGNRSNRATEIIAEQSVADCCQDKIPGCPRSSVHESDARHIAKVW